MPAPRKTAVVLAGLLVVSALSGAVVESTDPGSRLPTGLAVDAARHAAAIWEAVPAPAGGADNHRRDPAATRLDTAEVLALTTSPTSTEGFMKTRRHGRDGEKAPTSTSGAAWVASGTVPGGTEHHRSMTTQALLDLYGLTFPNGASVAGHRERWRYVWPRDSAFVVAAFAVSDHHDDAERLLDFLARAQHPDGTWDARYHPADATPVADGREPQLDASGWVPWAVWFWYRTHPDPDAARSGLDRLWPMVTAAADHAAGSLGPDGLPPASPDYWERSTDETTLGTAGPLLTGLRAAADLATEMGDTRRHDRYATAAVRLSDAVDRTFAPHGYPRTPDPESGADAAVTFLAPPFGEYDRQVHGAVKAAAERLETPSGGLRPGESWSWHRDTAWTPATSMFALAEAASGDRAAAEHWLEWLDDHRTPEGSFPERVTADHQPVSVAPLGWTSAVVVLAVAALEQPLPVPPDPEA